MLMLAMSIIPSRDKRRSHNIASKMNFAQLERAFLATLNEVAPGRTIIMITHRLIGIERLDRVWRLSNGQAVAAAA